MSTATVVNTETQTRSLGYKNFSIGQFKFERDEYFAHIHYPGTQHIMPIDAFLRALMRDVGWGFFYGTVNFDHVFGTLNHYGTVDMFIGMYNDAFKKAKRDFVETFDAPPLKKVFEAMLDDWTNEGFDPYAAPDETGLPYGRKHGNNTKALKRQRMVASRMVGLPGDLGGVLPTLYAFLAFGIVSPLVLMFTANLRNAPLVPVPEPMHATSSAGHDAGGHGGGHH